MIKDIKKNLGLCILIIIVTAIASIIISSITSGRLSFDYIFISNFVVGGIISAAGVWQFIKPTWIKKGPLIDHTTYKDVLMEKREEKKVKAIEILIIGIGIILLAGVAEIIVSFLI